MRLPWIVLGGGGHASVVIDALLLLGSEIAGFTDRASNPSSIAGVEFIGDDHALDAYPTDSVVLANGIGSTRDTRLRAEVYRRFAGRGYHFGPIVHPSAIVASSARIGPGSQVLAGAILQPNCQLAENVLVNTHATVDHDCAIGPNVHIAAGATLAGGVIVGEGSHIGAGAVIIQGLRIGAGSLVAAGAVVVRDVPEGTTVIGVPGRVRER